MIQYSDVVFVFDGGTSYTGDILKEAKLQHKQGKIIRIKPIITIPELSDVVVEEHYFVESKNANNGNASNSQSAPQNNQPAASNDGFMSIPEGIEEELPFI